MPLCFVAIQSLPAADNRLRVMSELEYTFKTQERDENTDDCD
jgi:hypothetical protein